MKKNPELTEQTKQNLVDAFWSLYAQKELSQISVKEITDRAGYNRSTFYTYFDNTEEVLTYVVERLYEAAKNLGEDHGCAKAGKEVDDAVLQRNRNEAFIELYMEYSDYFSVLFKKMKEPVFTKKLWEFAEPHYSEYTKGLSPEKQKELSYIVEYNLCGMFTMIAKWHRNGKDIPIERLLELVNSIAQKGAIESSRQIMEQ